MNNWNIQDLALLELDDKILILKDEFDKKNGTDIENYSRKLNSFINHRLRKESESVIKSHFLITISGLINEPKDL